MPYGLDETVVLTPFGRNAIERSPNSKHLMQRHEIQGLEIRAVRETATGHEIAFKWIREYHPAWAFAGLGCECETMRVSADGTTATMMPGSRHETTFAVAGLTERATGAGIELPSDAPRIGRVSFLRVDGGILVDDFSTRTDPIDDRLAHQEREWCKRIQIANGTLDPETVLLAIIQPDTSLKTLAASRCAELRWVDPSEIFWASRKFGFEEGTLIARTTYGNLADPIAAMKNDGGTVVDADLVVLPSFDSIGWDTPAGDDRMTLPQGAAMRKRPYADDEHDSLAA